MFIKFSSYCIIFAARHVCQCVNYFILIKHEFVHEFEHEIEHLNHFSGHDQSLTFRSDPIRTSCQLPLNFWPVLI